MKSLSLILISVLLVSCVSPQQGAKPADFVLQPPWYLHVSGDADWQPPEAEIADLFAALGRSLSRQDLKLEDYYLSFSAVTRGGKRYVQGFGSHVSYTDPKQYLRKAAPKSEDEEVIFLQPFGGGNLFFQFTYDCSRHRMIECQINAPL